MANFDFQDKTWSEIDEIRKGKAVIILPVGSTEAHGPHLALSTDVIISTEMARRAAHKLKESKITALVLPPISYSVTDFSRDFPGTISISKNTFSFLLLDIFKSLSVQGFRYVCIANSHLEPEHIEAINQAIEDARKQFDIRIAFPDKRRRRWASTLTDEFRSGACHAGCYETSLVMAVNRDLVRDEVRRKLLPVAIDLATKIKEGMRTFRDAGGESAYFGDPARATPEEGDSTYEALAQMLVTSVLEMVSEVK